MFTMIKELPNHRLFYEQAPAFITSFLLANTFYKFGSFGLELFAFLATWFAIDGFIQLARHIAGKSVK